MTKTGSLFVILLLFISTAYAHAIPEDVAVRIIVSEAADQGLKGMVCVGEVLRHRGSIKGFYGYPSNRAKRQPRSVWEMAEKAWDLSANTNFTRGADHFENIHRFGKPWWVRNCVQTYEYGNHVFFKEIHPQEHYKPRF
jgi:hypothetical protein